MVKGIGQAALRERVEREMRSERMDLVRRQRLDKLLRFVDELSPDDELFIIDEKGWTQFGDEFRRRLSEVLDPEHAPANRFSQYGKSAGDTPEQFVEDMRSDARAYCRQYARFR